MFKSKNFRGFFHFNKRNNKLSVSTKRKYSGYAVRIEIDKWRLAVGPIWCEICDTVGVASG